MGKTTGKEPCPQCRESGGDTSGDNLIRYEDGGASCFACGYVEGASSYTPSEPKATKKTSLVGGGEYRSLVKRGIREETCKHFGYQIGKYKGKTAHIAPYYDSKGKLVAQKLRFANKDFVFLGDKSDIGLFGQHLCRDGGKQLCITEGEIDAMSLSQLQNLKWAVVSVPNGASGAAKAIKAQLEWVEQFEKVIFMFDMDEVGQEAAKECAALLSVGKAYIARLPMKDANECLVHGKGKELLDSMWGAKQYTPDGILSIDDIIELAKKPIERGLPWCFPTLTDATYGRRWGEVYGFGAGTGVGKTDVFTQQIAFDITELNQKVGVVYLEQSCVETAQRIAGKVAHKRFHVPDADHTPEQLGETLEKLRGKVQFYDNFGRTEWDVVKSKIRYMVRGLDIRLIYLDHLTALADPNRERESLEILMEEMAMLAKELGCIIHFISHLTTPEGKPHEEGGRVMIRHFKGSRAIGFWSYFMFGLERDQQHKDPQRRMITTFRVLKDRFTGQATGVTFGLGYDAETGILSECPLPVDDDGASGFKPEVEDEY